MKGVILFPLRFLVFVVGLFTYWMEVAADWFVGARSRTEYVREGACKRCGRCCRLLALLLPEGVLRHGWMVRIAELWHGLAMNFHRVGEEEGWLVYRCGYYREGEGVVPGHCSIYPFRHRLCRFFPRQALYGHPSLHGDCGFHFVKREALKKKESLRKEGRRSFDDYLLDRGS